MIRKDDVKTKVAAFIKQEFPEIKVEVEESYLVDEIADILYEMLIGDFQTEETP